MVHMFKCLLFLNIVLGLSFCVISLPRSRPKCSYPLVTASVHCLNQIELLLSHSRVNQTMVQAIATGGMHDKLYT